MMLESRRNVQALIDCRNGQNNYAYDQASDTAQLTYVDAVTNFAYHIVLPKLVMIGIHYAGVTLAGALLTSMGVPPVMAVPLAVAVGQALGSGAGASAGRGVADALDVSEGISDALSAFGSRAGSEVAERAAQSFIDGWVVLGCV